MPPKQPSPPAPAAPDVAGYDEEHVPFDGVMRKLANTKPIPLHTSLQEVLPTPARRPVLHKKEPD